MRTIKLLFLGTFLLGSTFISAQKTSFGFTGGLLNGGETFKEEGSSASASDTGFYAGIYSRIHISEKISLQPEVKYGNLNRSSFGFLSAMVNYEILPKFYVQAGPELSHIFESSSFINRNGLNASFGIGYNITEKVHIQARYSPELTNRLTEDIDATSRINWLHAGIGFTF
jgi:hypothetical protein